MLGLIGLVGFPLLLFAPCFIVVGSGTDADSYDWDDISSLWKFMDSGMKWAALV